jgi:hypothetical protein
VDPPIYDPLPPDPVHPLPTEVSLSPHTSPTGVSTGPRAQNGSGTRAPYRYGLSASEEIRETMESNDQFLHRLRESGILQDLKDLYNSGHIPTLQSNPDSSSGGSDHLSAPIPLPDLQLMHNPIHPPTTDPAPDVPQSGVPPTQSGSITIANPSTTPSWLTSESKFRSKSTTVPFRWVLDSPEH